MSLMRRLFQTRLSIVECVLLLAVTFIVGWFIGIVAWCVHTMYCYMSALFGVCACSLGVPLCVRAVTAPLPQVAPPHTIGWLSMFNMLHVLGVAALLYLTRAVSYYKQCHERQLCAAEKTVQRCASRLSRLQACLC